MENHIKEKELKILKIYQKYISKKFPELKQYKEVPSLKAKEWGEFFIKDVFTDIQR